MYALVDCNNFYCSCERLFNPKLDKKPIVVLSNNDGCAIARSEEAKALGIAMGTPAFMMEKYLQSQQVAVFSSNYTLYGDISDRIMKTLADFVPAIEVYSIDEAYLHLHDLSTASLPALGRRIRKTVWKNIGIPVSIGIAPTKTLAKMANRMAKKHHKETGVFCAATREQIRQMLENTSVEDVCGIGHRYALLLNAHKFRTALDFANAPADWVRKHLHVVGLRVQNELSGTPSIADELEVKAKKNICTSRSFGQRLTSMHDILEAVANYTANCAEKLRKQGSCCRVMEVFVQTNPHKTAEEQYMQAIEIELERPTNSTSVLIKYATRGLKLIFKEGYRYMKAGVVLKELVTETAVQSSLFDTADHKKNNSVMKTMDEINKLMGKNLVRMATQGFEKTYSLQAANLSPRYTTDILQVLKVRN